MRSTVKLLSEFLPLAVFFITYKYYGLINATAALVIVTFITLTVYYLVHRTIPIATLISALLVGFFGFLTYYSGNPLFIKIKPTIINSAFALILIGGAVFKKGLLKPLMGSVFQLSDKHWIQLSLRWGFFFIGLAILNECIWRHYPEAFWVKFKVFGMLPLTMLFAMLQMPFILKHSTEEDRPS